MKPPSYIYSWAEAHKHQGRPIIFFAPMAKAIGRGESLLVSQLLYWTPKAAKNAKGEGWLYKSVEEIEDETSLTYREQCRCRKKLVKAGILEGYYNRSEHRLYFMVNQERLDEVMEAYDQRSHALAVEKAGRHMTNGKVAPDQTEGATLPTVRSLKNRDFTESTSESTTVDRSVDMNSAREKKIEPEIEREGWQPAVEELTAVDDALNGCLEKVYNLSQPANPTDAVMLLKKVHEVVGERWTTRDVSRLCAYLDRAKFPRNCQNPVGWLMTMIPENFRLKTHAGRKLNDGGDDPP